MVLCNLCTPSLRLGAHRAWRGRGGAQRAVHVDGSQLRRVPRDDPNPEDHEPGIPRGRLQLPTERVPVRTQRPRAPLHVPGEQGRRPTDGDRRDGREQQRERVWERAVVLVPVPHVCRQLERVPSRREPRLVRKIRGGQQGGRQHIPGKAVEEVLIGRHYITELDSDSAPVQYNSIL